MLRRSRVPGEVLQGPGIGRVTGSGPPQGGAVEDRVLRPFVSPDDRIHGVHRRARCAGWARSIRTGTRSGSPRFPEHRAILERSVRCGRRPPAGHRSPAGWRRHRPERHPLPRCTTGARSEPDRPGGPSRRSRSCPSAARCTSASSGSGCLTRHVAYAVDPARYSTVDHRVGWRATGSASRRSPGAPSARSSRSRSSRSRCTLAIDPGDGEPRAADAGRGGALSRPDDAVARLAGGRPRRPDAPQRLLRPAAARGDRDVVPRGDGHGHAGRRARRADHERVHRLGRERVPVRSRPAAAARLSRRAIIGARARSSIERGWACWRRSREPMLDFVVAPPPRQPKGALPQLRSSRPPALPPLAAWSPAVASPAREGGGAAHPLRCGAARGDRHRGRC